MPIQNTDCWVDDTLDDSTFYITDLTIFLLNTEPNCRIIFFLIFFNLFLFVCFLFVCLDIIIKYIRYRKIIIIALAMNYKLL
jgi:hypothetical protein